MATLTIVPSIDRSSRHARTNGSSRHRQPSHFAFDLKAVYLCLSANANVALVESYLRCEHLFKAVLKGRSINGFAWRRRVLRHQTSTILCANAYAQRTVPASETWGVGGSSSLFRQVVQTTLSLQLRSWRCLVGRGFYPRDNAA